MGQVRVRLHPEARQLAEHGGDRAERPERPMPQQKDRQPRRGPKGGKRLAGPPQQPGRRYKLEVRDQGCQNKIKAALSVNSHLT